MIFKSMESINETTNWTTDWGTEFNLAGCENCDTNYLIANFQDIMSCPHCGIGELLLMNEAEDKPVYTSPPEQLVPFAVPPEKINKTLHAFTRSVWIKPDDMKMKRLHGRLQKTYLPLWLVDADVQARWQAEVGYDYEVVSHREKYKNDQWVTQRIRETKIRWEPRVGTLTRRYDNRVGPALEEHDAYAQKLGRFRTESAEPYQGNLVNKALVRLPNRSPEDAWSTVIHEFRAAAIKECEQATSANHIREFKWKADFQNHHWTQMLLPIYTTYYLDDDKKAQMIFLHGQTGNIYGSKRASMKKAKKYALIILAIAAIIGFLSFLLFLGGMFLAEGLLALASLGFFTAVFTGIASLIPLAIALYTNHISYINTAQQLAKDIATLSQSQESV